MKSTLITTYLLLATFGLCAASQPAQAVEEEAHVLILNGTDPYLPAYLLYDSALRARLGSDGGRRIVFFAESLDAQRFAVEGLEPEFVELFVKKYRAIRVDVVLAITRPAVEFFSRHREAIWPDARLVFQNVSPEEVRTMPLPPGALGVTTSEDLAGSLALARRLQPSARRILVVSGVSEFDKRLERGARQALLDKPGTEEVEYLTGWSIPDLVARVKTESADTIVWYLSQFRDRDGAPHIPRDVLRAVSEASPAPVYGVFETQVGYGLAAAVAESYDGTARQAGQQVRAALAGGSPAPEHATLEVPRDCMADARALRRWSLDPQRLPKDCELRFVARSFWREHLLFIVATLVVILGQGLLIAALVVQRRRRLAAERAVQVQREELAHASRLAMAGELTASIAHEINQPLGAILSNADAAELILDSGRDQRDLLKQILADIRRDDLRASEVIRRLRALLARNEVEQEPFDVRAAVVEVASLLRMEADRRNVTIQLRLGATATVVGDRVQVQQVLINLLMNAMDAVREVAADRKTIVVSVERAQDLVHIEVRDRGSSIPAKDLSKVFESFYSTKRTGMGLGLSIARSIVEAHRGSIRAERREGGGTIFHLELPATDGTAAGPQGGVVS